MTHLKILILCVVSITIFFIPTAAPAASLVKLKFNSAVYYVDDEGTRHPYPTWQVFESWYGESYKLQATSYKIETLTLDEMSRMPLGENVTFRPGSLMKIPSNPTVYAVEPGGILRPLVSEQMAKDIYGDGWAKRVYDLPEVFWFDYKIGERVRGMADMPDGTLVTLETPVGAIHESPLQRSGISVVRYYWKDKGVLSSFQIESVVRENGLNPQLASVIPPIFPIRSRAITTRESRITEPIWNTPLTSSDCEASNLRAGVVYLSRGSTSSQEKIEDWRSKLASAWERRTDVLSLIRINPVEDMPFEDRLLADGKLYIQEVARIWFDNYPDVYDFLIIWNSLIPARETELAEFWPVNNMVEGLGKPVFDRGTLYGSRGKLKAVIHMGRPGDYPLASTQGMERAVETGLHEFLHQWSGAADFKDATGTDRTDLQTSDGLHWSPHADIVSPLGGWGWKDNGDGTFTSKRSLLTNEQLSDLHLPDLDFYLMGLVPRHSVQPIRFLKPSAAGAQLSSTMSGTMQTVTIDDIVYGNGVRRCTAP